MKHLEQQWKQHFDPASAIQTLMDNTTTEATAKQYRACLYDFLEFAGAIITRDNDDNTTIEGDVFDFSQMKLHTSEQIKAYMRYAVLKGRSPKTINKYLAPITSYIDELVQQHLPAAGEHRFTILEIKEQFDMAKRVDRFMVESYAPPPELKIDCELVPTKTIREKRNVAIAYLSTLGYTASRIYHIKLKDIHSLNIEAQYHIKDYVKNYNLGLEANDPRRITEETALWQPLLRGDNYHKIADDRYSPNEGLSYTGIQNVINQVTNKYGVQS